MNNNLMNEKLRQENAKVAQDCCGPVQVQAGIGYRPETMSEEAEKNAKYHFEQAEKNLKAANFLRENPSFEQFIRLVRSGSIHF